MNSRTTCLFSLVVAMSLAAIAPQAPADVISFSEGGAYTQDAVYTRSGDNVPANASANFNGDTDQELLVGVTINDKLRTLLEFDISAIPAANQIDSASLVLRTESSPAGLGGNITINAYEYGFDFDETTATWNVPGGSPGDLLSSATFDPTAPGVDVTFIDSAAFQTAVSDALAGDGFLRMILTHSDETITGSHHFARFDDETVGTSDFRPELLVNHSFVPTSVPEPASIAIWTLLGLCVAGYGYRRRRTR